MSRTEELKQQAAAAAVELVQPGMVLGLGEGSTALLFVGLLGERLRQGGLRGILGIAASERMAREARALRIPLTDFEEHPEIDLTIDGADEVDPRLDLIKGRGGALLREKILAQASRREVILVDESKLSPALGTRSALPVEVVPFGWSAQARFLADLGCEVVLRRDDAGEPYRTDQSNLILDCNFGPIGDPAALDRRLRSRAGIVEHGLFLGLASEVLVAGPDGIRRLARGSDACRP